MCGDHPLIYTNGDIKVGSPPHVRGPPYAKGFTRCKGGITPACAGTTKRLTLENSVMGDHPRMCGDHPIWSTDNCIVEGSPPHVRGPRRISSFKSFHSGITPACAGTTYLFVLFALYFWDHPRMCGDHTDTCLLPYLLSGSPPHVRGPHPLTSNILHINGITPACAGTTSGGTRECSAWWDHPRMCGDHNKG